MAAKKGQYSSLSVGNMVLGGSTKEINKLLEQHIKGIEKDQKLTPAQRKKNLEKLEKAKKVNAKSATPSYIKTPEGKFTITKTKTGKVKITSPKGKTVTVPKGQSVQKIIARGGAGGAFLENLK
jgi:hypothetical protein